MTVLVTGAAGFIGSHVTERLLADGHDEVGLDSFDPFYDPRVKDANLEAARGHASFVEIRGDIRDSDALARVPDDVDAVIHLAARAGVRPSIERWVEYHSVNVEGTLHLLDWMRSRGLPSLVFGSSSSVYGEGAAVPFSEEANVGRPISPYAATKASGELACHVDHHLNGRSVAALRLFTVYGPRQRPDLAIHKFARLIRAGRPIPVFGDGSTGRDYTFVADIVDGVVSALALVQAGDPRFEIINLGGSRIVSLHEMIRVLGEELGTEPIVEELPAQPGDVTRTCASVEKAGRLLGYRPQTGFTEGIRSFVRWLDRHESRPPERLTVAE